MPARPRRDHVVPGAQMAARARVPADQGLVGLPRGPDRSALRLRMAGTAWRLVPQLRQRGLGIRPARPDEPALKGRASLRARVWQHKEISVVDVHVIHNTNKQKELN